MRSAVAGPKRPQDKVALDDLSTTFQQIMSDASASSSEVSVDQQDYSLHDGAVVIAAITSCTNTSNPSVLMAAGLLEKKAIEKGLKVKPWVKTSLAPGSKGAATIRCDFILVLVPHNDSLYPKIASSAYLFVLIALDLIPLSFLYPSSACQTYKSVV